jgi:hypothetical protein
MEDLFLGGILELCVLVSGARNLGQTFGGFTKQCWLPSHLPVEGIAWRLDLLQGENPGYEHLVRPDDEGVRALLPSNEASFLESFSMSSKSSPLLELLLLRVFVCFVGIFVFFFFCFSAMCTLHGYTCCSRFVVVEAKCN